MVAQEFRSENADVSLAALGSWYELDKHVSPSWLVRARSSGVPGKPPSSEQMFPGGFSGLGAQLPLQNMCFLFSFPPWLRTENRVFLSGRASETWPTTS